MKKAIICGYIVIILGLLIALGSQFLFKVCDPKIMSSELTNDGFNDSGCNGNVVINYPICHWSARAEIGIGFLIAALGICLIVFNDPNIHLGLLIGIFFASIIALAIPHSLIGGCAMMTMQCRKTAFPALTIESVVLLVFSAAMITVNVMKKQSVIT